MRQFQYQKDSEKTIVLLIIEKSILIAFMKIKSTRLYVYHTTPYHLKCNDHNREISRKLPQVEFESRLSALSTCCGHHIGYKCQIGVLIV